MKSWLVLLSIVLLTGCARFHPQPLIPAQNAERLENRSLADEGLRTFLETNLHRSFPSWPTNAWDFEMLTMAAYCYQPSLEVARAQWAVAKGGETTAAQRPNPVLTATPGYDTTTSIPSPWIPLTFLDVPIETAGKRKYRRAQAGRLAEAARLNVATMAWQVRSDVRSALVETISAEQHVLLLQQQVELQGRIVNLLEGQVKAGAAAASQVVPFRIALLKARLDLVDAQRLAAEARAKVAQSIGIPLRALEGVNLSFTGLESVDLLAALSSAEIRRTALQSRPDILGALAEYAASESALQLEIAKQYPDVHLQPGYQYDQGDNKWTLGIVVDLPILNQNQGPIAEAEAKRQEAAARFNQLQAKVLSEIDQAEQGIKVAQRSMQTLQALMTEQTNRVASVSGQLKAGAVDQLELLNAQFESLATQVAELDGRLRLQQAIGALEDAVRHPFEVPAAVFESTRRENHEK